MIMTRVRTVVATVTGNLPHADRYAYAVTCKILDIAIHGRPVPAVHFLFWAVHMAVKKYK